MSKAAFQRSSFKNRVTAGVFGLLFVGFGGVSPALAGPPPFQDLHHASQRSTVVSTDLVTNWGYGPAENAYNDLILAAIEEHWEDQDNPLDPLYFKALIAVESAFKKDAVSRTGCAGLVQFAPDTAKRFGLSLHPVDQRFIPEIAIPAGVKVLAEKQKVVLEPQNYFQILLGNSDKQCPFGSVVYQAYQRMGAPRGNDLLSLGLASYNGGGGTIMRAMAKAIEMGKNPLDWNSLVGTGPHDSPLYAACEMIYKHGAPGKYREMADYPVKIFKLINQHSAYQEQTQGT